jgi:2,4-dienoyl-CoA reductase (NADPH2)
MGANAFPQLLSPGRIGKLALRNRIVMSPMGSFLGGADGHITERHKRFYEERARGGVGLVTTEVVAVDYPRGAAMTHQLALSDDVYLPGLRDLTDRVHALGAKISVQLQHAGKISTKDMADGRPMGVPSKNVRAMEGVLEDITAAERAAITANYRNMPADPFHELSEPEILRIVECFASAAERAQRAGFDAVEIHAGHGYLIQEFLSRHTNARSDRWGGSLENRARLLVEVLRAVRARVGPDFAAWIRLDGEEKGIPDGITREDALETGKRAAEAGADAIHVTRYGGGSGIGFSYMIVHEEGELLPYAEAMRRHTGLPVIAVGRLLPETAEAALAAGRCDFVSIGRQLLADPELPNKLARGERARVRPCVHCYTCVGQIFVNEPLKCAVNPACGQEDAWRIEPAARPRKILVVGGGPAGMEAARVAALRGHRVTLVERERHLGGTNFFSSLVYAPNGLLPPWQEGELRAAGVEIVLGREATPDFVRGFGADAVVVAVGARREPCAIPGAELPHVLSGDALRALLGGGSEAQRESAERALGGAQRLLVGAGRRLFALGEHPDRARELSKRWMPLGERVAVVGGGLVGLELAEFLVERGRHVTVIEEGPAFAPQMSIPRRWRTLHVLREHGAELLLCTRVARFTPGGAELESAGGARRALAVDHVLLATGSVPDRALAEALAPVCKELHLAGDAERVGYLEGAIWSGARVGRAL